jgi:hypothetical protein
MTVRRDGGYELPYAYAAHQLVMVPLDMKTLPSAQSSRISAWFDFNRANR